MVLPDAEGRGLGETMARRPDRVRQFVVAGLGFAMLATLLVIAGMAFERSSWWYHDTRDLPLDAEARARLTAARDELAAAGQSPSVVVWLNAALSPDTDPTDARAFLLSAQEELGASDDPALARAADEIDAALTMMRPQ